MLRNPEKDGGGNAPAATALATAVEQQAKIERQMESLRTELAAAQAAERDARDNLVDFEAAQRRRAAEAAEKERLAAVERQRRDYRTKVQVLDQALETAACANRAVLDQFLNTPQGVLDADPIWNQLIRDEDESPATNGNYLSDWRRRMTRTGWL
jgi:hypothetical protein